MPPALRRQQMPCLVQRKLGSVWGWCTWTSSMRVCVYVCMCVCMCVCVCVCVWCTWTSSMAAAEFSRSRGPRHVSGSARSVAAAVPAPHHNHEQNHSSTLRLQRIRTLGVILPRTEAHTPHKSLRQPSAAPPRFWARVPRLCLLACVCVCVCVFCASLPVCVFVCVCVSCASPCVSCASPWSVRGGTRP